MDEDHVAEPALSGGGHDTNGTGSDTINGVQVDLRTNTCQRPAAAQAYTRAWKLKLKLVF